MITMNAKVVPPVIVQCIIFKFLTHENMKPSEIPTRLRAQFGDETL